MSDPTLLSLDIASLRLDPKNPRFADRVSPNLPQEQLVEEIANQFGVDDLLSSLAVNGFFHAEPLVCIQNSDGSYTVLEGNRRLTACLILAGDPRAVSQSSRTLKYGELWRASGKPKINPIPCQIFLSDREDPELLSFLGVRHIAAAQPWDSYAKAAWVAKVVQGSSLTISSVAAMVGDNSNTVARLLVGYQVVKQLIKENLFNPSDSARRGRGSQTDFPFSWVYTILGYTDARDFVGLASNDGEPNPIPAGRLDNAALMFKLMFGDAKFRPAIDDSRDLAALAKALNDPEKLNYLEQGHTLKEVLLRSRPANQQLRTGLNEAQAIADRLLTATIKSAVEGEQEANDDDHNKRLIVMVDKLIISLQELRAKLARS